MTEMIVYRLVISGPDFVFYGREHDESQMRTMWELNADFSPFLRTSIQTRKTLPDSPTEWSHFAGEK